MDILRPRLPLHALRSLLRTPIHTAAALVTLTLGVGANVLLVGWMRQELSQSFSFREPERIVALMPAKDRSEAKWTPLAPIQVHELAPQVRHLEALVEVRDSQFTLHGDQGGEPLPGALVTAGGLARLGVPFAMGRDLLPDETRSDDAAVLTHGAWVRRFGQARDILSRTVHVDHRTRRIVGVLAPNVSLPWMLESAELFAPMVYQGDEATSRAVSCSWTLGFLTRGSTLAQARQELRQLGATVATPAQLREGWSLEADTFAGMALRQNLPGMMILGALAAFLLLLACANVAGLYLARLGGQAQEVALRAALGAQRWSLAKEQGGEILLLSLGAGALTALAALALSRLGLLKIDLSFLGLALGMALLATLLTALAPVVKGTRPDLRRLLNQAAVVSSGGLGWRKALVAFQVMMATVFLVGAGLSIRALQRLRGPALGLNPDGIATFQAPIPVGGAGYDAFRETLLARMKALPGVTEASLADGIPMYGRQDGSAYWAEIASRPGGEASEERVGATYFSVMRIPVIEGRPFGEREREVCMVSASLARRLWPGQPASGHRLSLRGEHGPWRVVVGVVGDHRHNRSSDAPVDQIFLPYAVDGSGYCAALVRTAGDPTALVGPMRKALGELHPDLARTEVRTLREVAEGSIGNGLRQMPAVLAGLAILAIGLAAVGLHGVAASLARQRTREFGVRHALGASPSRLLGQALRETLQHTLVGLGLGLVLAVPAGWALGARLLAIRLWDVPSLFATTLLVVLMGALVSLHPLLRAVFASPAAALRTE